MHFARENVEIHKSIDDYVGAVSRKASPYVNLGNVQILFLALACSLMLLLLVFAMHLFVFKQIQAVHRKLLYGLAILLGHYHYPRTAIKCKPTNGEDGSPKRLHNSNEFLQLNS